MTKHVKVQDQYPTLSGLVQGAGVVEILRDGEVLATVDGPNAAFAWLAANGNQSVSWMLMHGGYACRQIAN